MDIHETVRLTQGGTGESISAAPGIAVGVLMIIAAILWFSPLARWKFRRLTLWLVIAAIACVVLFGYIGIDRAGGGA